MREGPAPANRCGAFSARRPPRGRATSAGSPPLRSLDDLGDAAGAHGAATLTDGEAEALLHGDRLDELDRHLGVVPAHHDRGASRQRDYAGYVGGHEVALRP